MGRKKKRKEKENKMWEGYRLFARATVCIIRIYIHATGDCFEEALILEARP